MAVQLVLEVVVVAQSHSMRFSIIIPTRNEEHVLTENTSFFKKIKDKLNAEIIIVDGESSDTTSHVAKAFSSKVVRSKPSRSKQQNIGAEYATGDILIFMHADTIISDKAIKCIQILTKDFIWGFFKVNLNSNKIKYKALSYLINLRSKIFNYSTGDQVLIIQKDFFIKNKGFKNICLMEDIEFTNRIKRIKKPILINEYASTSARRWVAKGCINTVILMRLMRILYYFGASDKLLLRLYK